MKMKLNMMVKVEVAREIEKTTIDVRDGVREGKIQSHSHLS
jgi:hypothetical protein